MGLGGALAGPVTAFLYDWNMLPIGQQLWEKELESYKTFPPLQAPETYNLSGILEEVKKAHANHPERLVERGGRAPRAGARTRRQDPIKQPVVLHLIQGEPREAAEPASTNMTRF